MVRTSSILLKTGLCNRSKAPRRGKVLNSCKWARRWGGIEVRWQFCEQAKPSSGRCVWLQALNKRVRAMLPLATRGHQASSTGGLSPSWKSRNQEEISGCSGRSQLA